MLNQSDTHECPSIYKTVNDRFYPHPRVVNFWINATFPVTLKLYEITGFILLQTAWLSKNPITQNIGYYLYTIYLQKLQDPFKNLYNKIWKFCKIFEIFTLLLLFTKTWIILFKIKKTVYPNKIRINGLSRNELTHPFTKLIFQKKSYQR